MWPVRAFVLALSLAAASAAPAVAAVDASVPPTVLGPADGASAAAGSAVTFQVQTGAGDAYLWVRVSRSPNPAEPCGTIGDDVASVALTATSDPSVYAGTPRMFDNYDFWLNRAGTYYWQAYRISYAGGADGCIEAPVRALHVTGVRPIEIGPQPLAPADGATLPTGPVTFRTSALAADRGDYLWMHVSRSSQVTEAGGLIGLDAEIEAFAQTADPSVWSASPRYLDSSTFWMNQPGRYYWQPYRISSFGDPDGFVEGPVRSFTLTAAEPKTIRGAAAFTDGTPNDVYMACTKLDLWLVDVLPAGSTRVSVVGAADLRLKGRTADILLDGKRVGRAVIRSDGSFTAKVRAPSKARRARARYQARVASTASQNLRLERRMVNAGLTRRGNIITLSGRVTKPFARRADTIRIQRYRSCGVKDTIRVRSVRPDRFGRFKVTFARPAASVKAMLFRATTKVAGSRGGRAKVASFTLPRAIPVR